MSALKIEFSASTDVGKIRISNEDAYLAQYIWDDRHILLVVIDGMGGEDGGEVAAEIAQKSIVGYLEEFHNDTVLNLIKRAVADANNAIVRSKEVMPQYQRMGCVATAGLIDLDERTLSVAHVGDSRLYRYWHGELSKLTHDHSMVGYQEEQGILTEEQAMKHPRRSVIERCLGVENRMAEDSSFIEAGVFPLFEGETYLFCSDGLSDVLTSAQIANCLSGNLSPEEECGKLIAETLAAGAKDNVTVVVAHVESVPSDVDSDETDVEKDDAFPGTDCDAAPKRRRVCRIVLVCVLAVLYTAIVALAGFWIGTKYGSGDADPIHAPLSTVKK